MVSSEAAPFAKTGGLADVVGSLPAALQSLGDEVAVVIPRYGSIGLKTARRVYDRLSIYLGPVRRLHLPGCRGVAGIYGRLPGAV